MDRSLKDSFGRPRQGWADLHLHTIYSDGVDPPQAVVQKARKLGLQAIGITDHDAVRGIAEAETAARPLGIEVVPGIELSTSQDEADIHILGYFIDPDNARIRRYVQIFQEERLRRAEKIVQKLKSIGVTVHLDLIVQKAGKGAIGRPHIADALMEEGFVLSYDEAFYKYLAEGKPAYVPKFKISPLEGIELIHAAGGLAFVAHPGMGLHLDQLIEFIKLGLDGIEILHPKHNLHTTNDLYQLAIKQGLLVSGGSDSHGERNGENNLGLFNVPYQFIEDMKSALQLRHAGNFG